MYTGIYRHIPGQIGPYGTIWDHTGPYQTIPDHAGQYGEIPSHIGPWDLTGPYWTLHDHMEPHGPKGTICDHPVSYRTIKYHMAGSSQPQHFFAATCSFADFAITVIFYPAKNPYFCAYHFGVDTLRYQIICTHIFIKFLLQHQKLE